MSSVHQDENQLEDWDLEVELQKLSRSQKIAAYQCDNCEKMCDSVRKEQFRSIPSVLLLHLLIFNNQGKKIVISPTLP